MSLTIRLAAIAATFVASAFALAVTAQAETITVERDTTKYSSLHGGELKVLTFTGASVPAMGSGVQIAGGLFQTFCLEADTSISNNTTYDYTVGTGATDGGVSGGNPDPLSDQTAYLFTEFWKGTLASYNYTAGAGRVASATSLQLAIWYFEGELIGTIQDAYDADAQAQSWVSEATTETASGGSWFGLGIGDVLVINPTTSAGGDVQSMLVLQVVPLPPALLSGLSLLVGLGGLGLLRRRSRRALV